MITDKFLYNFFLRGENDKEDTKIDITLYFNF